MLNQMLTRGGAKRGMTYHSPVPVPGVQRSANPPVDRLESRWALAVLGVALAMGVVGRWSSGWGTPLWFDETYSGLIATQDSVSGLYGWCLRELTGIAYYAPLWAWEKLAGNSDAALRVPSFVMSLAAPLVLFRYGHHDRRVRYFWALFALLWLPAWPQASEARPYAQLFLLGCAQAIFFLHGWREPRLRWAVLWSSASALAMGTHYFAAPLAAVQAIALLVHHRARVLALWPALLPFAVLALWMSAHVPVVLRYMAAGATDWYRRLEANDLTTLPHILFGSWVHGVIILTTIGVAYLLLRRRPGASPRLQGGDAALVFSGVAAYALVLIMGFFWPSFQVRYLTPAVPAMLFTLALWARWAMARDWRPVALVAAMFALAGATTIRASLTTPHDSPRWMLNLELPSAWLMETPVDEVVFLWQGPVGEASSTAMSTDVAGFAFKRAKHPVKIRIVRAPAGSDAEKIVLDAAGGVRGRAILWFASVIPLPRDPRYECRNFGDQGLQFVACRLR